MKIGVPKEIKEAEYRVSIIPTNVRKLVDLGHEVIVENNAGLESGFTNKDYENSGASVVSTIEEVYKLSDMILKVKEFLAPEYDLLEEKHILFTYIHSANRPEQTKVLLDKKLVAFAYEDVKNEKGEFPLLTPMSEIAGDVGLLMGVHYLFNTKGGCGKLICGAPGCENAKIVIIGAGNVGMRAAKLGVGLGADVSILDTNISRMRDIKQYLLPSLKTIFSNRENVKKAIADADLVINAVKYIPGVTIITREMLKGMKKNALIVDIDAEPNGAIETCRYSTHDNPIYVVDGIRHFCVANLPSAVSQTASTVLSNSTIPYVAEIANKGWEKAALENDSLRCGLDFVKGYLTFKDTAVAQNIDYYDVRDVLDKIRN